MDIFTEIKPLRALLGAKRSQHLSIGLVPTMGALHAGHLELIKASKSENDITVCSIYVNPAQFNSQTDLEKYPRTLENDKQMLVNSGCDLIFAPVNEEMYQQKNQIHFDFGSLDTVMEGKFRPGHFSGVALVVSKLFNIVQPNRAYFGQKDFQQYKIISKTVDELLFDLTLSSVPIVREEDGLAMSSRNQRLKPEERKKAPIFYQLLVKAKQLLEKGQQFESVKQVITQKCESIQGIRLEYLELADQENLNATKIVSDKTVLLIAGYVGEIRLIDNILMG